MQKGETPSPAVPHFVLTGVRVGVGQLEVQSRGKYTDSIFHRVKGVRVTVQRINNSIHYVIKKNFEHIFMTTHSSFHDWRESRFVLTINEHGKWKFRFTQHSRCIMHKDIVNQ